ncbi:hypothetical protein CVT24_008028 [Panaeolus cyanescens]|uniref:Uncharacterized protein n=1 Tax=Panaeolus cyanescens TaxID=181874 RepID=A0A409YQX7_9AGAR|nr:hypothetical protein CVT24_008028 [Panaeolus cyanescens]
MSNNAGQDEQDGNNLRQTWRAMYLNTETEAQDQEMDIWQLHWNQSLSGDQVPLVPTGATGPHLLLRDSAYPRSAMNLARLTEHAYPASINSSENHASGIAGISRNLANHRGVAQHFGQGPNPGSFADAYHQDNEPSFFEQISAEHEEYIASLERSSAFPQYREASIQPRGPVQINQIRSGAEFGRAPSNLPPRASSSNTRSAQAATYSNAPSTSAGPPNYAAGSYNRLIREEMYNNPAYHSACAGIVDIMAQFKVPLEEDDSNPVISDSTRAQVFEMLANFINSQPSDIQQWLGSGQTGDVASQDIMKAAVSRRSSGSRVYMHYCYWCDLCLTTKGNLASFPELTLSKQWDNMSQGLPRQPHLPLNYQMEGYSSYTEEYLEPIDQDLLWLSTDFTQFTTNGAGAVNDTCFSDPFNTSFTPFAPTAGPSGLLFAPPQPQAAPQYYLTSPNTMSVPLPTPSIPYSSPWVGTNEFDDISSPGNISVRGSISAWSEPPASPAHTASPLLATPGSGWAKQQKRKYRENIYHDSRYSAACSTVIGIMGKVKVQVDDGIDVVGATCKAACDGSAIPQTAQAELAEFILGQDPDIQKWLKDGALRRVGSDANIKAASARLPGPSWDEEVVPALRKRLESESRTLAKRISAISLSSLDEPHQGYQYSTTPVAPVTSRLQQQQTSASAGYASQQQYLPSSSQNVQPSYQQVPVDRTMSTSTTAGKASATRANAASSSKPSFQRARTYSSPYGSDFANQGGSRPKASQVDSRAISPRPTDIKPTRIPKVANRSHSGSTSQPNSPYVNGYGHTNPNTNYTVTPPLPSPEVPPLPEPNYRGIPQSSSSRSTLELSGRTGVVNRQQPIGLMNEPAPFPTDATTSSGFSQSRSYSQHGHEHQEEDNLARASMESEERPFEHWYRGEVSRNGGVGELRVGRRQEMLDIANYGHLISKKQKSSMGTAALPTRQGPEMRFVDEPPVRKRAGSIAGITERERGSLYLDDDESADRADRVLDENPLTDLEGDVSDATSISDRFQTVRQRYLPPSTEEHPVPSDPRVTTKDYSGIGEGRSTTPTALSMSRSVSATRQGNLPPTRIPGPSSRRSSESRPSNKTPSPPLVGSTSTNLSSSTSSNPRLQQQQGTTSKRGVSPAPGSSSTAKKSPGTPNPNTMGSKTPPTPSKSTTSVKKGTQPKKVKPKPKRTAEEDEAYRRSVAQYPSVDGDENEGDMADAIPSWTQPVPKSGNWDEVVLPVVARKKGLDGHYENADGTPQPRKIGESVAPAPGTFGYDHTKYRRPQAEGESIPMDEFGLPHREEDIAEPDSIPEETTPKPPFTTPHDETRLPARPYPPPSPVPFSSYPPTSIQVRKSPAPSVNQQQPPVSTEKYPEEKESTGCCGCVIM